MRDNHPPFLVRFSGRFATTAERPHESERKNIMEVSLTPTGEHVNQAIESRLMRICHAEWLAHSQGKNRKRPLTYSCAVQDLLSCRQRLLGGESAESIMAEITGGEIQHVFLKS